MAQIDDFKAELAGGGYRPNQFRVTITPPSGIAIGLDVRKTSILCKGTTIPDITLGDITLTYRGRSIKVAGDKGISIGENSKVLIQNVKITDTKIGIASKDLSDLKIDIANVNNALVGFSVFQKKDEFGPASIEAKNIVVESCIDSFWVETKSKLIIDNNHVSPNKENIKEILYWFIYYK